MTSKLIYFVIFPCMIIALLIALVNPSLRQISFGDTYYNFMKTVSRAYDSWRFEIPKIPEIDALRDVDFDSKGLILGVLIKIARAIIGFINVVIKVLNILVLVLNVVIKIIQFCLSLVYCLIDFRNTFRTSVLFYG